LQIDLSNLGRSVLEIGALREAEGVLRKALVLNHELKEEFDEAITLRQVGQMLSLRGGHSIGHIALSRMRYLLIKQGHRQGECLATSGLADRALWLGDLEKASAWAESAWKLAAVDRFERDFIRAALMQGRVALRLGDFVCGDERLHHALTRARAVNVVEFELPALIAIAELELKRGHPSEARARLDDVWEAAERGPYPIQQADACNVLADIALAEGHTPAAIAAAIKAYRTAWCDGPPYAYHWGLTKAKAHLAALGAPEPDMPPFDESKFEPMPEVEINPKDENWVDPDKLE
jgi:tetratricopeptide (TPR) repeat protein